MNAAQWYQKIENGGMDDRFIRLYGSDPVKLERQRTRYLGALAEFSRLYGDGELSLFSAPGRVELCGNHTDHQNGVVLAAAVNLDIIAVAAGRDSGIVRLTSAGFAGEDVVDLAELSVREGERGRSSSLIRGIAADFVRRGGTVGGLDIYTTSDVLPGSGLSSSAAFEVCVAGIFNEMYNGGRFSPPTLAMIGQRAENDHFGKPSGLMDQTASAVGGAVMIDFANPEEPRIEKIHFELAASGHRLIICNTGGSHADLTGDYAAVREEMEAVAAELRAPVLRAVDEEQFYRDIPALRDSTSDRAVLRAIHFFDECRRVYAAAGALRGGDFGQFLEQISASGQSSLEYNQNAYVAAAPGRQGIPLALALSRRILGGLGACRLTGGGFEGVIEAFVPDRLADGYCAELERVFGLGSTEILAIREDGLFVSKQ